MNMKAIGFSEHGTLDQVGLLDVPKPAPQTGEVLIEVKAAALNRLDLWVLAGWPSLRLHMPHIMGSDGAGIVAEVGEGVTEWQVGDRVAINPSVSCGKCRFCLDGRDHLCPKLALLGEHLPGFYAEYQRVPARNLLRLADGVSFETAAAASLVFVTAWHSLIVRGQLRAGESVLIVGAGGGVNTAAIQIARLAGASDIYVIGSTDKKLVQAQALGATVLINRQNEPNWAKAIYKATGKRGVDIAVDNVGAATYHASLRALSKGGRLLTVGNTSGAHIKLDNRLIFGKQLSILGSTMGNRADYIDVMKLVFAGKLNPVIDTIYPLAEGLTALKRLEQGDVQGKLILQP